MNRDDVAALHEQLSEATARADGAEAELAVARQRIVLLEPVLDAAEATLRVWERAICNGWVAGDLRAHQTPAVVLRRAVDAAKEGS